MKRGVELICQAIALNIAARLFILSRNDLEYSASSSPADRLLHLLKTRGPQLASDAGEYLGTTGEAARQQLVKLAASGLAEAKAEVRGVGRPTQVWHLTAAGHARFPDTHSELTVQLLQTVRETFGEDSIDWLRLDRRGGFGVSSARVSLPTTTSPSFTAPVRRISRRTEA